MRLFHWLNCPHPHGPRDAVYWDRVRAMARWLKTDGCSSFSQIFMAACLEHDVRYRTRCSMESWITGELEPITRLRSDWRMLLASMSCSPVRVLTPVGWARFVVLRVAGWKAWRNNMDTPLPTQGWPQFTGQET